MRVSTTMFQQAALNSMLDRQVELSRSQQQLASGKRILAPSDDPIASAMLVDISQSLSIYEQYNRNAGYAEMRLRHSESTLGSVTNALHRARELAIQGNNGTYSAEQRKDIAAEVRQLLDEVLTLANATDDNGNYMFAGSRINRKPFEQTFPGQGIESTFTYQGDQLQRRLQVGPQRTVPDGDSGFDVFNRVRMPNADMGPITNLNFGGDPTNEGTFRVRHGNDERNIVLDQDYANLSAMAADIQRQLNDPSGNFEVVAERDFLTIKNTSPGNQPVLLDFSDDPALATSNGVASNAGIRAHNGYISVLEAIDRFAVELENNTMHGASITRLDMALSQIVEFKSEIGARMNSIERQKTVNEDFIFNMTTLRSELEDVDFAEAISRMNLQMVGMQAAQQTFTRVQNLSLFNYL